MAEVNVDDDTLQAVLLLWQQDRAGLAALFPRPIQGGRLKSTRAMPQQPPYAHVASEALAVEHRVGYKLDRRKVTLTVRGTWEQARDGLAAMLAVFNRDLRNPALNPYTWVYPSGARFVSWLPTRDGELKLEETTQKGLDVWAGVVEATVTSVRGMAAQPAAASNPDRGTVIPAGGGPDGGDATTA